MAKFSVTKNQEGKLEGVGEAGRRAYNRFLKHVKSMAPGEIAAFDFHFARSPKFHRLHMKMMAVLFENQEQFTDELIFRKYVEVGAGHCIEVPGPNGRMGWIPDSIAYDRLDDEEYRVVHENCKAFVRSQRYQMFFYPHVSPEAAAQGIENILAEFER